MLSSLPFSFLLGSSFTQDHILFWPAFPLLPALSFKLAHSRFVVQPALPHLLALGSYCTLCRWLHFSLLLSPHFTQDPGFCSGQCFHVCWLSFKLTPSQFVVEPMLLHLHRVAVGPYSCTGQFCSLCLASNLPMVQHSCWSPSTLLFGLGFSLSMTSQNLSCLCLCSCHISSCSPLGIMLLCSLCF